MKIKCLNQTLMNNINIAVRAISTRTTMDILECILITAEDNEVKLFASNLEMSLETENISDAEIIQEGRIVLDGKMLSDITRRLDPDKMVTISDDSANIIKIECDKSEFNLLGHNPDEYPSLPFVEQHHIYRLGAQVFRNMIRQTIYSVAQDTTKPVFTGALIEYSRQNQGGQLSMVALDGIRMAYAEHTPEHTLEEHPALKINVPARALSELLKITNPEDEFIALYATEKHALFKLKDCTLVTRLIEGEFIDYHQIFNVEQATLVTCERQALLAGLERASLIAVKEVRKNPVRIEVTEEILNIASNAQIGTVNEEIDIDMDGKPLKIGFNPRYIIDALKAIDTEFVSLSFNSHLSPCIIKPVGDISNKHLVLPLRLE